MTERINRLKSANNDIDVNHTLPHVESLFNQRATNLEHEQSLLSQQEQQRVKRSNHLQQTVLEEQRQPDIRLTSEKSVLVAEETATAKADLSSLSIASETTEVEPLTEASIELNVSSTSTDVLFDDNESPGKEDLIPTDLKPDETTLSAKIGFTVTSHYNEIMERAATVTMSQIHQNSIELLERELEELTATCNEGIRLNLEEKSLRPQMRCMEEAQRTTRRAVRCLERVKNRAKQTIDEILRQYFVAAQLQKEAARIFLKASNESDLSRLLLLESEAFLLSAEGRKLLFTGEMMEQEEQLRGSGQFEDLTRWMEVLSRQSHAIDCYQKMAVARQTGKVITRKLWRYSGMTMSTAAIVLRDELLKPVPTEAENTNSLSDYYYQAALAFENAAQYFSRESVTERIITSISDVYERMVTVIQQQPSPDFHALTWFTAAMALYKAAKACKRNEKETANRWYAEGAYWQSLSKNDLLQEILSNRSKDPFILPSITKDVSDQTASEDLQQRVIDWLLSTSKSIDSEELDLAVKHRAILEPYVKSITSFITARQTPTQLNAVKECYNYAGIGFRMAAKYREESLLLTDNNNDTTTTTQKQREERAEIKRSIAMKYLTITEDFLSSWNQSASPYKVEEISSALQKLYKEAVTLERKEQQDTKIAVLEVQIQSLQAKRKEKETLRDQALLSKDYKRLHGASGAYGDLGWAIGFLEAAKVYRQTNEIVWIQRAEEVEVAAELRIQAAELCDQMITCDSPAELLQLERDREEACGRSIDIELRIKSELPSNTPSERQTYLDLQKRHLAARDFLRKGLTWKQNRQLFDEFYSTVGSNLQSAVLCVRNAILSGQTPDLPKTEAERYTISGERFFQSSQVRQRLLDPSLRFPQLEIDITRIDPIATIQEIIEAVKKEDIKEMDSLADWAAATAYTKSAWALIETKDELLANGWLQEAQYWQALAESKALSNLRRQELSEVATTSTTTASSARSTIHSYEIALTLIAAGDSSLLMSHKELERVQCTREMAAIFHRLHQLQRDATSSHTAAGISILQTIGAQLQYCFKKEEAEEIPTNSIWLEVRRSMMKWYSQSTEVALKSQDTKKVVDLEAALQADLIHLENYEKCLREEEGKESLVATVTPFVLSTLKEWHGKLSLLSVNTKLEFVKAKRDNRTNDFRSEALRTAISGLEQTYKYLAVKSRWFAALTLLIASQKHEEVVSTLDQAKSNNQGFTTFHQREMELSCQILHTEGRVLKGLAYRTLPLEHPQWIEVTRRLDLTMNYFQQARQALQQQKPLESKRCELMGIIAKMTAFNIRTGIICNHIDMVMTRYSQATECYDQLMISLSQLRLSESILSLSFISFDLRTLLSRVLLTELRDDNPVKLDCLCWYFAGDAFEGAAVALRSTSTDRMTIANQWVTEAEYWQSLARAFLTSTLRRRERQIQSSLPPNHAILIGNIVRNTMQYYDTAMKAFITGLVTDAQRERSQLSLLPPGAFLIHSSAIIKPATMFQKQRSLKLLLTDQPSLIYVKETGPITITWTAANPPIIAQESETTFTVKVSSGHTYRFFDPENKATEWMKSLEFAITHLSPPATP